MSIFSGFYELGGGAYDNGSDYIYSILDWKNNPGWAAVTSAGGIIFAAFGHLIFSWGVYRLRVYLVHRIMEKNLNQEVIH